MVIVEVSKDSCMNYIQRMCSFKFFSLVHSSVYSCIYYSHIVTEFLIYFILPKNHFCLYSPGPILKDDKEQFSTLAAIRITCRAL